MAFRESNDNAILKMKFSSDITGVESIPFEDLVSRDDCFIRIDFPDGHSLMEHDYKQVDSFEEKFFVEFFDSYYRKNLIGYFSREESDYRITDSSGTVIRLAHHDLDDITFIDKKAKKHIPKKFLGEELHAFYGDIQLIQNTFLKIVKKKDK